MTYEMEKKGLNLFAKLNILKVMKHFECFIKYLSFFHLVKMIQRNIPWKSKIHKM